MSFWNRLFLTNKTVAEKRLQKHVEKKEFYQAAFDGCQRTNPFDDCSLIKEMVDKQNEKIAVDVICLNSTR